MSLWSLGLDSYPRINDFSVSAALVQRAPEECERSSNCIHCLDQKQGCAVKIRIVGSGMG